MPCRLCLPMARQRHTASLRDALGVGRDWGADAPVMNDRATITASLRDVNQGRHGGGGLIVLGRRLRGKLSAIHPLDCRKRFRDYKRL
ncbi:MAG: hypothetical protein KatS3mg111_2517 [Pirellulaceae bacterium]|nr:MAG: hypothetical protein KatS3mg111_2517 [Pirellulaceae bacterium]